jgi:transposase InsO family protein
MESWNSTFKRECGERFFTNEPARLESFDSIEVFYSQNRIHAALGSVSPAAFERQHRDVVAR